MRFLHSINALALITSGLTLPSNAYAQNIDPNVASCMLDAGADFESIDSAQKDPDGLFIMRDISIELVGLTPADRGANAQVYLKFINFGELNDHFICATTSYANAISATVGGGAPLPIAAGAELNLSTPTRHLVLKGLVDPIIPGQKIELLFQFDFGGLFKIKLPVQADH